MDIPVLEQAKIQARVIQMVEGMPGIRLQRTQTIMQGASHCDFRYARQKSGS